MLCAYTFMNYTGDCSSLLNILYKLQHNVLEGSIPLHTYQNRDDDMVSDYQ